MLFNSVFWFLYLLYLLLVCKYVLTYVYPLTFNVLPKL